MKLTAQSQENLDAAVRVEIESAHATIASDYLAAVIGGNGRVGYLHAEDEGILRFPTTAAAIDFIGKNRNGLGPLEVQIKKPPTQVKGKCR